MYKKILKIIVLFLIMVCFEKVIYAVNIRTLLHQDYNYLNEDVPFKQEYAEGWLENGDRGVLCIHYSAYDSNKTNNAHNNLKTSAHYCYYDKIIMNPNGNEPEKIYYYSSKPSEDKNTDAYAKNISFLARLFYEGRTSSTSIPNNDGWHLLHEYRNFCKYYMNSNFKNWFNNGSFKWFVDAAKENYLRNFDENGHGHYSSFTLNLYNKSSKYSSFINNLNKKNTINNEKNENISEAISNKKTVNVDTSKNWKIEVSSPYYKKDNYYDGVKFSYAFIDSSNYNSKNISFKETSVKLQTGQTGNGYKKVVISGDANSNTKADTLIIKCSYTTYTGLALGFATTSGQERFLVSGKENTYDSYIAYDINTTPNVTISKKIIYINATKKDSKSENVEPGDTVIFKVEVSNSGGTATVNLSDNIPSGLTLEGVSSDQKTWSKTWKGITNTTINKGNKIIRYFKCKVNDNATGTITNTATVSSSKDLNKNGKKSLSDSASVKVLGYKYTLTKSASKSSVEPGETFTYTITLKNELDTKLYNMTIEDTVPAEFDVTNISYDKTKWSMSQASSNKNKITFTRNNTGMGKGTNTFTITCKVIATQIKTTNNIAYLKTVKNKNGTPLDPKQASAEVKILGYSYKITKTVNKDTVSNFAEYGEEIQYQIKIENTGTKAIKNIIIEDAIPSQLENITISGKNWSSIGNNQYKYSGTINNKNNNNNNSTTLTIKAIIKKSAVKETDSDISNTATIKKVYNTKNVDITTELSSTAKFKLLGYKADLKKYITGVSTNESVWGSSTDRSELNDESKYNSPQVVKKENFVTYKIEFKNNSQTADLNTIKIQDDLPAGLTYKDHKDKSKWSKSGNIYTYSGNVAKGHTITLEIKAKVTMSNMYLLNIKNEATVTQILNKADKNIMDLQIIKNQKASWKNTDYVRLAELTIAGTVWNDPDKDGLMESGENGISGITVVLRDENNAQVDRRTTDANGKYTFTNVQKGTNKDTYGNYSSSSQYKQYYIEFEYNGIQYESTKYANNNNLTGDGKYNENYPKDSNAAERTSERDEINRSLETISYNKATGNGGTVDLAYTKEGTTSIIDYSRSVKNITAKSFINPSNGSIDYLWLYKTVNGGLPETDYLNYINLGLVQKDNVDLDLQTEIESFTETINGQEMTYIPEEDEFELYGEDYRYRYDTAYTDEDIKRYKGEESELNIEVKFKTTITNNDSSSANAVINELTQYYDENFKSIAADPVYMRVDSNNDGIFNSPDKSSSFSVQYIDEELKDITASEDKEYADLSEKTTTGYQTMYITGLDGIVLKPGESITIYTNYIVDKDDARALKIGSKLGTISEINAYSTYTDEGKPAGAIDIDSNPGNLGETDSGKNASIEDTRYYEDDTGIAEIKFTYPTETPAPEDPPSYSYERELSGIVWEDLATEDSKDGHKIGNGILDEDESNKEPKIENIKVQLFEIVKIDEKYKEIDRKPSEIRTNGDGEYTIKGFIPGQYIVRFTYGDIEENIKYNGQDYKSTTYTIGNENSEDTNDNLQALMQDTHFSDARDAEQRRLEVMNYSLEMYNGIAEVLKGEESSDKEELKDNTYMFADTPKFIARIEKVESDVTQLKYEKTDTEGSEWQKLDQVGDNKGSYTRKYEINNIDFGLQERPRTQIDLQKYIKEIQLTTAAGDVLVDAKYDDSSNLIEAESKGFENIQSFNNTDERQGFRYINVDEELLQGATFIVRYGFKVINNSEVDHISSNLYGTQDKIESLTTEQTKAKMTNAIGSINNMDKYTNSGAYYGKYLGGIYYTGEKTDDVVATIKVDMILDYVDTNLVFNPVDNGGKWGTITVTELMNPEKRYLNGEVFTELKDESGHEIKASNGNPIKVIVDYEGAEYEAVNKNNLAITVDDPGVNSNLSKQLKTGETATVELITSTVLSSESESDDMEYGNIAEIIKFTTLTGRRTVSTETVGNAKVNLLGKIDGYKKDDPTLGEPDTSIVERITLTPPTGLSQNQDKAQAITKMALYITTCVAIVIVGILYVPKLIIKIKDRKFIK